MNLVGVLGCSSLQDKRCSPSEAIENVLLHAFRVFVSRERPEQVTARKPSHRLNPQWVVTFAERSRTSR